jgi:hypothetical protein
MLEVDEGSFRPELLPELIARNQLAGSLQEDQQHFDSLALQSNLDPSVSELSCLGVNLEGSEPENSRMHGQLRSLAFSEA